MNSIQNNSQSAVRMDAIEPPKATVYRPPVVQNYEVEVPVVEVEEEVKPVSTGDKIQRSFFDRYVDKIKDFLDNAE